MNTKTKIKDFINSIKINYPLLSIGCEYDETLDEFDIWHTDQELEFNNQYFKSYVGSKAEEYLFSNNIYNFSFGYDHYKFKELEISKNFYAPFQENNINLRVHFKKIMNEELYSNNFNFKIDTNIISKISFNETNNNFIERYENIIDSKLVLGNTIYGSNLFEEAA